MSEPGPSDQTKPTHPPARPDDRTVVTDLSGGGRTDDIGSAMTVTGQPPEARTALTAAPGGDIQDAIPTHPGGVRQPPSGTDVTNLHVGAGATTAPEGSHLGQTWGDFTFIKLLGRGGMGAVYLGRQISLDRQVAIKVLPSHLSENEQFRERFQLEAKAVAKISSPNVIAVYAAGVHEGHHYFAMEFVDGEDLSRRLRHGFKPSYRQALELTIQAARGLAAAGEHGIVHRDIKPGNMMIDRKGSLKIMDFGLVRLASAGHSLTMSGTVMGTVSYFSPEQGRGEPCDQRTDLYALGVVFYELLTGRLPFTGENATSVIYQHIHSSPRAPRELDPNIPDHYQAVVLKCMQKRADDRYTTAGDLLADLERLAAGQEPAIALERPDLLSTGATIIGSGRFSPPAGAPAGARSARRGRGTLVAGLAVLAAAGGGAAWWLTRAEPPPPQPVVMPTPAAPTPAQPDPKVAALLEKLAQDQDLDRARREAIGSAEAMTAEGRFAEAEQALAALAARLPDDVQLASAQRKVKAAREAAARQAAATQTQPAQPQPQPAAGTDAALTAARAAIARGELPEARRLVNVNRGLRADDPAWAEVAKSLDVAEGKQALFEATAAFERGNIEFAGTAAAKAKALIPEDPARAALLAAIEQREGQRRQRERVLLEADNLLTENQPGKAEELLAALAAQHPEDAQVANALRRARAAREKAEELQKAVSEQLSGGQDALRRNALDEAQLAFTAARQLDPKNEAATAGLNAVRERKEAIDAARRTVEAAISAGDMAKAEAELARLQQLAPGSPQAVLAAGQLSAAKAVKAEERARAEARERKLQDLARQAQAALDDLAKTPDEGAAALAAFTAEAGDQRPELPRRLDDRRARAVVEGAIAGLAAAIAARDAAKVAAAFSGADDARPFIDFMGFAGARLSARLAEFTRTGDTAIATVDLVHAMDLAPESRTVMRWTLARADGAWRVTASHLETSAEGNR
jgi:predicted Ser/Thr protein kinase